MTVVFKTKGGIRHPPIGAGDRGGDKRHVRRRLLTESERGREREGGDGLALHKHSSENQSGRNSFSAVGGTKVCLKVTAPFTEQALIIDFKELKPSEL